MVPLLRAPQVLGSDDRLLDPAAETDVDDEGGAAAFHDRARHPVEPVVRPSFLDARINHDRHPLPDLERREGPRDRGEPPLAGAGPGLLHRHLTTPLPAPYQL